MATETVSLRERNVVGNKFEDSGTFTASGTTGEVSTTLHWIESLEIISPNGDGTTIDTTLNLYPNTKTATTTEDADDAGWFHFAGADANSVYQFRVLGA